MNALHHINTAWKRPLNKDMYNFKKRTLYLHMS